MQNLTENGKRVLIVGSGIAATEVARYLIEKKCTVTITDLSADDQALVTGLPVSWELGGYKKKSFERAELIVLTPGIDANFSELKEAIARGVPVTNEGELALREITEPVIAITGSCGKSSTSTLISKAIRADGKICFSGGTATNPLMSYVLSKKKAQFVIAELACQSLSLIHSLTPTVAVFTNIAEGGHEGIYPDMESYVEAQRRLLELCSPTSRVVLNLENPWLVRFSENTPAHVLWFSTREAKSVAGALVEEMEGAFYNEATEEIIHRRQHQAPETYSLKGLPLTGKFHPENIMAALCATRAIGVEPNSIHRVIGMIGGVPHLVHEAGGIPEFDETPAPDSYIRISA